MKREPCKFRLCLLAALLTQSAFIQSASGQTLTEKLVQEDPAKLLEEAGRSGDIVRGAILFHQGNINCAKCHRPTAEKDRIGPDLSRMAPETTDFPLVESILQPSKTIRKGFESTVVVTVQGQVYTGIVVSQDGQQLVLRSGQNIDQLITLAKQDIEETKPSPTSNMPAGLVNELKHRQQFLDLLRYVIELRSRGPVVDGAQHNSMARRELSDELKGRVLINKLNCIACHESDNSAAALAAKQAPELKWSAKWLNPRHLAKFIADPRQTKPGTSMPHLLGHLNEVARRETAEAIVQYLAALDGNHFQTLADSDPDRDAILQGHELFHTVGCVACHAARNETGSEQPLDDSIPLGELTGKYDASALTAFLEDPHAARPSGRMPNMVLTHREALDLSSFLLQSKQPAAAASPTVWKTDTALAQTGKQLFIELNCVNCHTSLLDSDSAQPAPALQRPLAQLNVDKGCLSGDRGNWPDFQLVNADRQHIGAALQSAAAELTNTQQIELTLASLNCIACHRRDDLGGVTDNRSPYFQTTNLNLGEQGRIPPTLTGVGAKLQTKWMRDVLVNHRSIRPYMKTRMPQYGEQNVGHLIELFQTTDQLSEIEFAGVFAQNPDTQNPDDQKQLRKQGLEIVGNRGLNCVACHTYQFKLSDTMPAVDLTEMAERLQKPWFFQYMQAPQKFSPNTVMPSYWPNGRAIRPDIEGDAPAQVAAIWQYLLDGRQASAPPGVIREPLEIVVAGEARMLRRSYAGIGKRGIGVGYPGDVNIAFDAEQLRLADLWKGRFVDPSGVWYGQGHGTVRPLGPAIEFAKGPELDDRVEPWVVGEGRPPKHHFQGYVLDEARRPVFRYTFESIEVEDFCSEFTDPADGTLQLRRRIRMTSAQPRSDLRFRLAAGHHITAPADRTFVIERRLSIRIVSDHPAKTVAAGEGRSLQVPLDFSAGQNHELVLEYRWE